MNKKDNILSAALVLFVEQGEQRTSMKLIAKKSNCGIGTMYNYFPSKDELINELYIKIKTDLFSNILNAYDPNIPVKQQFIDTWLKVLNYANIHRVEYKFLDIFAHSPKISKEASNKISMLVSPIMKTYEKGKFEGIIKNYDTLKLITFINGAISSIIQQNKELSEKDKKTIILMAWDAIKS